MASRRLVSGYTPPALALVGLLALLGWLMPKPGFWADKLVLALAAAGLVAALWRLTGRTNRTIARFLLALEHGDLAQSFRARGHGAGLAELGDALDRALARLRGERLAAAADNRFAAALVDGVPTPLLAIDDAGAVHLANKAARRLFPDADGRATAAFARYGVDFAAALGAIGPGRRQMARVLWNGTSQRAVLAAAAVDRQGRAWRVVSVAIIQSELETAELATQADLVRVLTHEIMNSLTPVTSLAESAAMLVAEAEAGDAEAMAEVRTAIGALARRASGITHFVDTYRDFGRTPKVTIERFAARAWLDELVRVFAATPQARGVALDIAVEPDGLHVTGDPDLLGQVVLNLLKNAAEAAAAVRDDPQVTIAIAPAHDRTAIAVRDNGAGIAAGLEEEIFLPFFTTRPSGSGIGLSFAKQVVLLHGGAIAAANRNGGGAEFRLEV